MSASLLPTRRMAETLSTVALSALCDGEDDELASEGVAEIHSVEIQPMADGSGNWAVFSGVVDKEGTERTFRTTVNPDGRIVASEELN